MEAMAAMYLGNFTTTVSCDDPKLDDPKMITLGKDEYLEL
jgi:hypothetical protein